MKGLVTPGRLVRSEGVPGGRKVVNEVRTFLWDNPEIRRAFREASERERFGRGEPPCVTVKLACWY